MSLTKNASPLERPSVVVITGAASCCPGEERKLQEKLREAIATISDFIVINFVRGVREVAVGGPAAASPTYDDPVLRDSYYRSPLERKLVKWGPMAVLIPDRATIAASSIPLVRSRWLHRIVCTKFWNVFIALSTFFGIGLTQIRNIPHQGTEFDELTAGAGLFILGVTLSMHASMYDRGLFKKLLRNFQFWYLAVQVLLGVVCMTYEAVKLSDTWSSRYALTAVRIFGDGAIVVALFGLDASSISRPAKGVVSLLVAVTFALWGFLWKVKRSAPLDDELDIWIWKTTPRNVLQSTFLTEAAFFANYAFSSLYRKHHTIMLRILPQRLALDRVAGASHRGECTAAFSGSDADERRAAAASLASFRSSSSSSFHHDVVWTIERPLDLKSTFTIVGADAASGGIRREHSDSVSSWIELENTPNRTSQEETKPDDDCVSGDVAGGRVVGGRVRLSSFKDAELRPSAVLFTAAIMCHYSEETAVQSKLMDALFSCSSLAFVSTSVVTSLLAPGVALEDDEDVDLPGKSVISVAGGAVNEHELEERLRQSTASPKNDPHSPRRASSERHVAHGAFFEQKDGQLQQWLNQKILIPKTPAYVDECVPLVRSPLIHSWTIRVGGLWYIILLLLVAASISLLGIGFTIDRSSMIPLVGAGATLYSLVLFAHVAMFNKGMFLRLSREFEFWYLVSQSCLVGITCAFEVSGMHDDDNIGASAVVCALLGLCFSLQAVAMVGMDACFAPRVVKGTLSGLMGVLYMIWACASSRYGRSSDDPLGSKVDVTLVQLSVRFIGQNAMITLALFCAKYCFTTLILRNDALVLRFPIERLVASRVHYDAGRQCWVGTSELKYSAASSFECVSKYIDGISSDCDYESREIPPS